VLNKEHGILPKGNVLSHITVAQIPMYKKLLFFSDAAVIPRPTLEQFEAMLRYDLEVCRRMGIEAPRVALIHCTEKVNEKFPHTLDYVTLKERAAAGAYGNMYLDGPMDVKTACDAHSGEVKGISSPVVGHADLLIFPNIESGNTFYKTVSLFGDANMADMFARGALGPLQVAVGEKFPRMTVVDLVFVGKCRIHAVLVEQPYTEREASAASLCARTGSDAHTGQYQDNRLFHGHSSSNRSAWNESAASTSS
jgi:hypothetical protein